MSAFAAVLIIDGYVSSLARALTRTTDVFFLIAAFFSILALITHKHGMPALLGIITGLICLGVPGAPFPPHITLSIIANGFVFDSSLFLWMKWSSLNEPNRKQLVIAGSLGNMVMAITALIALQVTVGLTLPLVFMTLAVLTDTLVGAIGALFGYTVARRLHVPGLSRIRFP